MPDVPSPQDASADDPVTEVDQEKPPTPQGRADDTPEGDGAANTDVRDDDGDTDLSDAGA